MRTKLSLSLVALLFSVAARGDDGIEPIADPISAAPMRLSVRIVELDTRGLRNLGFDFVANNRGELRATSERFVTGMIEALSNEHLVQNDAQITLTSADQETCETMVQWNGRAAGRTVARRVALTIRPNLDADDRVHLEIGCVAKADRAGAACATKCAAACPEKCPANCPEACAKECKECPECPATCGGQRGIVLHRGRVAPESVADDTLCFVTDFCEDGDCDHEPACGRCFVIVRADWQTPADDCLEARLPRELSRSRQLPEVLPEDVLQPLHWEMPIPEPAAPEILKPAERLREILPPEFVPPAFPTRPYPTSVLPRFEKPGRRFEHTAQLIFQDHTRRAELEKTMVLDSVDRTGVPIEEDNKLADSAASREAIVGNCMRHDRLPWAYESFMKGPTRSERDFEVSPVQLAKWLLDE